MNGCKLYNKRPNPLGVFNINVTEWFHYTYLPIKLKGDHKIINEKRLEIFDPLIGRACCDFVGEYGLDRFIDSYVYITAKHQYQKNGNGFNRAGWHSDGFLTEDISYIWSNKQPTIFNNTDFILSEDDSLSMEEMENQADLEKNFSFPNYSLIRMDQYSIHKVGEYEEGNRAFVKICISKDKYQLKGNSINYNLDYNWEYHDRKTERNIPQS